MSGFNPNQPRDLDGQWTSVGGRRRKATTFTELGHRTKKKIKAAPRVATYHTLYVADDIYQAYKVYRKVRHPLRTGVAVVDQALNKGK